MNIEINSKSSADEVKPYPGLRCFQYKENYLFFGREGKAQEIANRLQHSHFVAVVGTSGSGKSSLVRAGLLPLLYGGMLYESGSHWRIAIMRPEETPIHNLAEALTYPVDFETEENCNQPKDANQIAMTEATLRRSGVGLLDFLNNPANGFDADENLLVVVDQFEELFRFKEKSSVEDMEEAAAFVKLLLEATRDKQGRIFVVITMRSDFLGDCAEFRDLPEAINDGQYLIPRMTRDQLRQSIESPAFVGDAQVSPALVNRLLNDLEDQNQSVDVAERNIKDHLPILQHALMRTWDLWKRQGNLDEPLDIKHYEDKEIGGMAHALSRHANEAFNDLDEQQKAIAEKMFKCLTETDNENREIRRPAKIEEVCAITGATEQEVCRIVDVFRHDEKGRTFLMPPEGVALTKDTKIDISHESLIRNWERLKDWVKKEAENAWLYRRISEDAALYNEYGQDVGSLWSGRALELALKWREEFSPTVAWAARYQRLNEQENSELNNLRKTSPLEEKPKRREIINRRFQDAMTFLDVSQQEEDREQDEREQILKIKAKERFNRMLGVAAAGLMVLVLITTVMAYVAYRQNRAAQEQNELLVQAQDELERKNSELTKTQSELKIQNETLNKAKEKLEDQKTELEKIQKELNKNNDSLSESIKKTKAEKLRADKQAQLAKEAQALAQEESAKTKSINAQLGNVVKQLDKNKNLLNNTLQGTIAAEANDYNEALRIFTGVVEMNLCGQAGDIECRKSKASNDWWAYHNIATSNVPLRQYQSAEKDFINALQKLDDRKALITKNISERPRPDFIVNASFQPAGTEELEAVEQSKIITLRRFAEFYRDCGRERKNCSEDVAIHVLSPAPIDAEQAKAYYEKSIARYKEVLDTLGDVSPTNKRRRIFKGGINKEIADLYKALKNFGFAKVFYKEALKDFELDPKNSAETIKLMKNLLESTIQQLSVEPDLAKNLKEADDLVSRILTKTETTLSASESSDARILYNKTIGHTYEELSVIFVPGNIFEFTEKVKELKKRSETDGKIKEVLDNLEDALAGNDKVDDKLLDNLTPEQKEFWNARVKYLQIENALSKKMSSLSNVGRRIQSLNVDYDNSTEFVLLGALANAYIENGECPKALKIVKKMYDERNPTEDVITLEPREEAQFPVLRNLRTLAVFYTETLHDDDKVVGLYNEWQKAFKEKFSDYAPGSEEEKFNEGKDHVSFYLEMGKFYYQRGDYDKAQEMFNEYRKFADKNERYLSQLISAGAWNRPRALLTRLQLDILTARSYELRGNKEAAIAEYANLLTRVQNWISSLKEPERSINTNQLSNTANINRTNTGNVNAANVANTAANANRTVVAPTRAQTSQYLTVLYKEAALYEAYVRVRLADLYLSTGKAEKIQNEDLLNARSRVVFDIQMQSPRPQFQPFMMEGYISGLRNIAKFKQSDNEQSALYYQSAINGLDYYRAKVEEINSANVYRNYGFYSETYLRYKTLSKEFYNDYAGILTSLDQIKPTTPERANKLKEVKKKGEKAVTFKELEKPFTCPAEPNPPPPRSNLTAKR